MAGESIGKAGEALVALALRFAGIPEERIFWNARPAGMSITTDFALGTSSDSPEAVLLVTHSVSPMQSHKKFWRNIGELVEIKTALPTSPQVISIFIGDAGMEKLSSIAFACMDDIIDLRSISGGTLLLTELRNLASKLKGKSRNDTVALIEEQLTPQALAVAKTFSNHLKKALSRRSSAHSQLWSAVRGSRRTICKLCSPTSVKRGVAKFLIFDESDRHLLFIAAKQRRSLPTQPPPLAVELGLLGGLGNQRVTDPDMIGFAQDWAWEDLQEIVVDSPIEELFKIAIAPIRAIVNMQTYSEYVLEHRAQLITSVGMNQALKACHLDPGSLVNLTQRVENVWLVDYLFSLFKAHLGGHNEYGQSQLAEDIGNRSGISESGYRFFADWINRRPKGKLSEEMLDQVAAALAKRLAVMSTKDIEAAQLAVREFYIRTFVNIKLLTYENLNPLESILKRELNRNSINYRSEARIPSVWGEIAGENAATSSAIVTENGTAFYCSTVTDAGRDHKRKELEGRAVGMKWAYAGGKIIPRSNIKRMVLIIDGTWLEDDVSFLSAAGWHEVIYPHEVAKIVAAGA